MSASKNEAGRWDMELESSYSDRAPRNLCKAREESDLKQAIASLEEKIKSQDKPKSSKILEQLSSDFSSLLVNLASIELLAFLGIA